MLVGPSAITSGKSTRKILCDKLKYTTASSDTPVIRKITYTYKNVTAPSGSIKKLFKRAVHHFFKRENHLARPEIKEIMPELLDELNSCYKLKCTAKKEVKKIMSKLLYELKEKVKLRELFKRLDDLKRNSPEIKYEINIEQLAASKRTANDEAVVREFLNPTPIDSHQIEEDTKADLEARLLLLRRPSSDVGQHLKERLENLRNGGPTLQERLENIRR